MSRRYGQRPEQGAAPAPFFRRHPSAGRQLGLVLLLLFGGIWLLLRLPLSGTQRLVVTSGSMKPALQPGDQVLVWTRAEGLPQPGEIWTFQHPRTGAWVTHRVIEGGDSQIQTKGDANPAADPWQVKPQQLLGRVWCRIPFGGYPDEWLHRLLSGLGYSSGFVPLYTDLLLFAPGLGLGAWLLSRHSAPVPKSTP